MLCEKIGANIDEVKNGMGKDERIGPHFLQTGIGYGGSCFPKDTKALVQLAGNVQHPFELLEAVIRVNKRQQSFPVTKAKELLGSLHGKRVTVLGLAFKPNTDDVREAASLTIISELLAEGAIITAFDPIAIPNARQILGDTISYQSNLKSSLLNADLAIIATDWDVIKQLPLTVYTQCMRIPFIIDGRNCYPLQEVQKQPLTYISIGRSVITLEKSLSSKKTAMEA